ncbi:hypothetical protein A2690_04810 [Candidatus Roizmanbacteria bacterium RIFCSPHIGHO2_01_FULL_39_12b]|uniref:Uncharacterized protein n=1 Tax=Candidatus Roizmanbacteria bacterium RIFCSPHIGHO2_01_FULL_39_12b TaxID=1802030 RepID=A0A1F7GDV9_9BACT|nr:MAG: hypothetical protein A2690_04810 [Candidatus Roizmanbacteria bacterium RIFCSPHIGHO2_01_FULL_39_12b]OGK46057.1 MAG: hypothetical protein A3B46_00880 [Candidatus Roizmanbacteria bacterium RIFCSPLOWO2_01_FULL_39_19]
MEIIDRVFEFIQSGNLFVFFTKLFGIVLGGLYLFFTLVMVQQVITLKKVVEVHDRGILLLLSQIQFVAAIGILLYAVVIL